MSIGAVVPIAMISCGSKQTSVPVSGVKLDNNKLELVVVETYQLKAIISPENATNKYVTWESSDNDVAIVGQNGKVTAVGPGWNATITVTTEDNRRTTTCSIHVI